MINYHSQLVAALKTVLPTHYELTLTSGTETPCISYMELTNFDTSVGDTLGYSSISYQIKIWGNSLKDIQKYALQIDRLLRTLGFKRISSNEMYDPNSTMIQKILTYEAIGLEKFQEE